MRIVDGKNLLDLSAVHPESYSVADKLARDLGCTVSQLVVMISKTTGMQG